MKMEKRNILLGVMACLIVISLIAVGDALRGSLGSSRMVLTGEVGQEFERDLEIINTNNESVNVTLHPSGDLVERLELEETSFIVEANETREAYFTISSDEEGTFETQIAVAFTPLNGGNGVVLLANIIVVAGDGENENEETVEITNPLDSIIGGRDDTVVEDGKDFEFSPIMILLSVSVILVLIFIILIVYASRSKEKRSGRPRV